MEDNKKKMHYQRKSYCETTLSERVEKIKQRVDTAVDKAAGYAFWTAIGMSVIGAIVLNVIKPTKSHKSKGQFESAQ